MINVPSHFDVMAFAIYKNATHTTSEEGSNLYEIVGWLNTPFYATVFLVVLRPQRDDDCREIACWTTNLGVRATH